MHDPMTVAFEIHYFWHKDFWLTQNQLLRINSKDRKYHTPFITIWHVDPEKDGSDDSCGYSYPKVTKKLKELSKKEAEFESSVGGMFHNYMPIMDTFSTIIATFQIISWRCFKRNISPKEMVEIINVCTNPVDNLRHCAMTKNKEDVENLFYLCVRSYLRMIRPWYKHPKWHIWHWKLQIHPLEKIKRFLFDRCAICKKGFKWGESAISNWDGDKIWHHKCDEKLRPPEKISN
jgi:hypothetical protein